MKINHHEPNFKNDTKKHVEINVEPKITDLKKYNKDVDNTKKVNGANNKLNYFA